MARRIKPVALFFSYSYGDKAIVDSIAEQLRERGRYVWIDTKEILAGDNVPGRLASAIDEEADIFVAFLSKRSCRSKHVQWEQTLAITREIESSPGFVIPVIVDQSLKTTPKILKGKHFLRLSGNGREDIAALVEDVEKVLTSRTSRKYKRYPKSPGRRSLAKVVSAGGDDSLPALMNLVEKTSNVVNLKNALKKHSVSLSKIAHVVRRSLGVDAVILLWQEGGRIWRKVSSEGLDSTLLEDANDFVRQYAPLNKILAGGAILERCRLIQSDHDLNTSMAWSLWVPLTKGDKLLGLIAIFRWSANEHNDFDVWDREALEGSLGVLMEKLAATG